MNYETNCELSEPVNFEGNLPKNNEYWNFKELKCTTTDPMILNISEGDFTAYINQSWDFGQLFLGFLLVIGIFVVIAERIFLFCFDRFVAIIKTKKLPR